MEVQTGNGTPNLWGFDIGGTKCAVVVADGNGHIQKRHQVFTADYPGWQQILDALLETVKDESVPAAIGVSCGGPLDSHRGLILSPPNLPGWDEVPITDYLSERVGAPCFLQNDANACALAEWRFGAGKGCKNMVFLTFGTGFGAGLILNGHLYEGTNDNAGEIGHVRAAEDGPLGYGKAGGFEGFCSGGGIAQLSGGVSAKEVVQLAEKGDAKALEVLNTSAKMLGRAASLLIDVLNPERIVVGSIFARAEKWFRDVMEAEIEKEALAFSRKVCKVVPAELGDSIGDVAAITVAINGLQAE